MKKYSPWISEGGITMKKRAPILTLCVFAALACLPAFAQGPQPVRKLIYSLEAGEEILQPESAIFISATKESVILLLSKGKGDKGSPFFVVKNGNKKGPFTKLEEAMEAAYKGEDISTGIYRDCADYTPDQGQIPPNAVPSTEYDESGGQTVVFKGKTFGPYLSVLDVWGTPDGSRAYFTVNDKDKLWLICSDGRKVPIAGSPETIKLSPDGKNAIVACTGSLSPAETEELAATQPEKFNAEMNKKYVYTIDGKRLGPYGMDFKDFWFSIGNNNFFFLDGNQLYMNGNPILTLKIEPFSPCDFYPSADGRKYALFTLESLVFSDGKKYPFPLSIITFQEGGQTMIKWVALENKKDIVVYQRTI
jgi:hypothetical protein